MLPKRAFLAFFAFACLLIVGTFAEVSSRNVSVSCWECDRESHETCNILRTVIDCPSVTDVCFVKAESSQGDLIITKGCQPRDTCVANQKMNGAVCDTDNVIGTCNWCCETDKCNDQVKPSSSPVPNPVKTSKPTPAQTKPPTTTVALPASTTGVNRRNTTLQCWECDRENLVTCDALRTLIGCPGVTDVCFLKADNVRGVLIISRGCQPREECISNQQQNGPLCKVGAVTDSCNWCCDGDMCNDRVNPTTKAPVDTTPQPPPTTMVPCTAAPTTPPSQCDLVAYRKCDAEMQQLAYSAFVTPDQLLKNFCSFLPELSKCVIVIQGCAGCGGEIRFNSSLIGALINMSSLCSSTCDVTAAMLCLNRYYQKVSMALITGDNIDCVHLSRVRVEQQSCYALAISSCDMTVRKSLETFFLSIERQVINVCFAAPPNVQPSISPPASSVKPSTKPPKPSTKPPSCSSATPPTTRPSSVKPSTKPPGSSAKPSTKPPGSSAKPSTKPPGNSAKPSTKPPGSSAKPSTKPPGSSAKPTTKPPGNSAQPPDCSTPPAQTTGQTTTVTAPPPTDEDSKYCNRSLAVDCITSFNYEVMKYQSNDENNIVEVCRKLELSKECYIQASLNCSKYTCAQLTASWNLSASIVSDKCVAIVQPKCDTTAARACILELWNTVDGAKDFETACRLLNATITCVETEMEACSLDEIVAMNNSLQIIINMIGNRCDNVIEISPGCNSSIEICEGDNNGLIFYQFGQSPTAICGSAADCRIFVDIDIEIGGVRSPRCRDGKVITQAVVQVDEAFKTTMTSPDDAFSREITEANWNQNQTISLAGRIDLSYDGDQTRQVIVTYRKTIAGQTVESRTIGTYHLRICDRDRPSICSIVNDPHITTFDGWYYNNFQEGFFVVYKHQVLPYEVQVATQKCNALASCNCAAGVRSGDTVFFIDSCRKKSFVQRYCRGRDKYECVNLMKTSLYAHNQITPGTRIFSRNNGKEFVVWFPHGTMVKITYNGNYLNLWITPSPGDWRRTEGLCGIWDGRPQNDLMLRDGTTFVGQGSQHGLQPITFDIDWRVPDADLISGGVAENTFLPPYYCVKEQIGATVVARCGYDAILETCDLDTSGVEILVTATLNDAAPNAARVPSTHRVHKRAASPSTASDFDMDSTSVLPAINGTNSAWNETAARAYCQNYFQSMAATGSCMSNNVTSSDSSLNACVDDLVVTGNTTWMDTAMEALKEQCLQEIQRNPVLQSSPVAAGILSAACLNQCSQNGICSNGTCVCNSTFSGPDCSIDKTAPVSLIVPVNNGLCDVRASNCYVVQILGVGFIPEVTTCIVQPAVVTSTVAVTGQSTNLGTAVFISPSEVHCVMSELGSAYVQLTNTPSNSAVTTSSSPLFIVYDSVCFTCIASDGVSQPSCTQMSTSCVINGQCYASGEQNPQNSCQVCNPSNSTSSFSSSTSSACTVTPGNNDESQVGLIVGLTVGLSALIAIVIGLVTWLCIKRHIERSVNLLNLSQSGAHQSNRATTNFRVDPPRYDEQMSHSYRNESFDQTQTHSTDGSQKTFTV